MITRYFSAGKGRWGTVLLTWFALLCWMFAFRELLFLCLVGTVVQLQAQPLHFRIKPSLEASGLSQYETYFVLLSEGLNVVPFCWESRLALAITRVLPPWAGRSVQEGTSQDEFLANSGSHLLLPDREAHRNDSKRENGLELLFEHRLPALWEN